MSVNLIANTIQINSSNLTNCLTEYLKSINITQSIQPVQFKLINMYIHHCYSLCKSIKLNTRQTIIYVNILFEVLINNNPLFSKQSTENKNIQSDWTFLEQRIKQNPYISAEHLCLLITSFKQYYFNHFSIFEQTLTSNIKSSSQKINILIDYPQLLPPLSQAIEKPLHPIMIQQQD